MTVAPADLTLIDARSVRRGGLLTYIRRHPTMVIGGALLGLMVLMAVFAPYLGTVDPQALSPIRRLRWPSAQYWFGTDMLGRDVYSRTIYGARVSLTVHPENPAIRLYLRCGFAKQGLRGTYHLMVAKL